MHEVASQWMEFQAKGVIRLICFFGMVDWGIWIPPSIWGLVRCYLCIHKKFTKSPSLYEGRLSVFVRTILNSASHNERRGTEAGDSRSCVSVDNGNNKWCITRHPI